ncbi:2-hydroxyacylsphingosine 1-beta-galactosyltransferase [Labeo rohita]|uniref:2-hydroxyacylsphingosine 1-beta-galactosyltransferase n=1 Tax=Labeo rohita TaxID=84645 RepID=A0ABQ8LN46_LABRO|nr:2-hydroxyacylsphingosine 1-beta-galactosyltransferase [Labeo rohita]
MYVNVCKCKINKIVCKMYVMHFVNFLSVRIYFGVTYFTRFQLYNLLQSLCTGLRHKGANTLVKKTAYAGRYVLMLGCWLGRF